MSTDGQHDQRRPAAKLQLKGYGVIREPYRAGWTNNSP
jgi:hypothetical protein